MTLSIVESCPPGSLPGFLLRPDAAKGWAWMVRTRVLWITFLTDSASNFLGNSAEHQLRQGV
jgi:hypothetical protein